MTKEDPKTNKKCLFNFSKKIIIVALVALALIGFAFYKVANKHSYITVSGIGRGDEQNQIANFSVTAEIDNENKQEAVEEVSEIANQIITDLKEMGIDAKDIKTTGLNIYQREIYRTDGDYEKGNWYASYSIQITLRDLSESAALTGKLASYENTTMWGPSLTIDYDEINEEVLLEKAIEDARQKASAMATKSNRRLGKVLNISEGYSYDEVRPMYRGLDMAVEEGYGGGDFPIEPGTSKTSKNVTVTFRLW